MSEQTMASTTRKRCGWFGGMASVAAVLFAVMPGCSLVHPGYEIEKTLHTQRSAWNEGDIEAFMSHYWRSPDLTFSAGGQTTRGWQATLDRYKNRYATPSAMGTLNFTDLEVHRLGPKAALVLGRWRLDRESGPVGGNFTLVMRRVSDRWVIVHDHTSSDEAIGAIEAIEAEGS